MKGRFGWDYAANPDRLRTPLVRREGATKTPNPGDPLAQFRETSWAEALDCAAHGFLKLKERYGASVLGGFGTANGSNEEGYLLDRLWHQFSRPLRPDRVALLEAARASSEMHSLGMTNQVLVLNGVFHAADPADPLAVAVERRGAAAIAHIPEELVALQRTEIPLLGGNIVGLDSLRLLFAGLTPAPAPSMGSAIPPAGVSSLADLLDELAHVDHGLVMVMGKGGVGKTTVAAAIAVALAKRGLPIHLTTTDPAQHIREMLASELPGLRVSADSGPSRTVVPAHHGQ